jgi:hypothetical protein
LKTALNKRLGGPFVLAAVLVSIVVVAIGWSFHMGGGGSDRADLTQILRSSGLRAGTPLSTHMREADCTPDGSPGAPEALTAKFQTPANPSDAIRRAASRASAGGWNPSAERLSVDYRLDSTHLQLGPRLLKGESFAIFVSAEPNAHGSILSIVVQGSSDFC